MGLGIFHHLCLSSFIHLFLLGAPPLRVGGPFQGSLFAPCATRTRAYGAAFAQSLRSIAGSFGQPGTWRDDS
jgi:hypothetical protein